MEHLLCDRHCIKCFAYYLIFILSKNNSGKHSVYFLCVRCSHISKNEITVFMEPQLSTIQGLAEITPA